MKLVRAKRKDEIFYGVLEGDRIDRIEGDLFGDWHRTGDWIGRPEVQLLAPVAPVNIFAIGLNYRKHASESEMDLPERPLIFLKATTAATHDGADILLPKLAPDEVDYEAELCVVIGKTAKDLEPEETPDYILGYTCGNDVSARDCQLRLDGQWARGKSFDTFAPLGPHIETEFDPTAARIQSRLNGQVMQDSNLSDLIFPVKELVSYLSKNVTLLPGTVIMTGTPGGVGFAREPAVYLREGDLIEVEIEGLGVLKNRVKRA